MSWVGGILILTALGLAIALAVLAAIAAAIEVLPSSTVAMGEPGDDDQHRARPRADIGESVLAR